MQHIYTKEEEKTLSKIQCYFDLEQWKEARWRVSLLPSKLPSGAH